MNSVFTVCINLPYKSFSVLVIVFLQRFKEKSELKRSFLYICISLCTHLYLLVINFLWVFLKHVNEVLFSIYLPVIYVFFTATYTVHFILVCFNFERMYLIANSFICDRVLLNPINQSECTMMWIYRISSLQKGL